MQLQMVPKIVTVYYTENFNLMLLKIVTLYYVTVGRVV